MKAKKRFLSLLLTACLLVGLLPTSALAAGGDTSAEGYTINYEAETITIDEGYEVYTAETGGTKIESGGSITSYIGGILYIQKSGVTERSVIAIPQRPQAPSRNNINIDMSNEVLTIDPTSGLSAGNLEYSTQSSGGDRVWGAVPASLSLSEIGWSGSMMYLYFRIKATETAFASTPTTGSVMISARPPMPSTPCNVSNTNTDSITISTVLGQQYRYGTGGTWSSWQTGTGSTITFNRLSPGTEYTIENRFPYTRLSEITYQEEFASFANSTTVTTLYIGTVTVDTDGNGTASASAASAAEGTEITLTAKPNADSHFVKWEIVSGDITITDNKFTMPAENVEIKAVFAEHTYGEWQSNNNGTHTRTCSVCGDTQNGNCSGGEATCKAPAICAVCGQPYGKKDMNNHTDTVVWVQTETTHKQVYNCCQTEASQEEKHNWRDGKCTVCDYPCEHKGGTATCSQLAVCELCGSQYGALNPDNHKAVSAWTQENGKHYHKCEYGCDTHLDEADCSGGEANCTAMAVCETCGNSYGAINPDNHTGEIVWTKTATDHSSAYDCCGATVVAKEAHEWENGLCSECGYECQHDGGTATCADKAVCDTCGEEYGKVNASNHTNLVKTEAKPATHMTVGNIEYWYCDGCDKYFSDEAGTKEIALKDTVIPKLTEHTADSTGWHSDETNHWNTCECGEKLNEAAHTFEWVIDKEATATEKGSKHEECTVCGYAKAAVEIPATGDDAQPPQTGDDSNIVLWIAVMLAAGAALTGTALYSRKRKYSK